MLTEKSYSEEVIKREDRPHKDNSADTAVMLINIYFPELRPALDAILQRRDQINRIKSDFKRTYQQGEPCESFLGPFLGELGSIETDEKRLTDELFRISQAVN